MPVQSSTNTLPAEPKGQGSLEFFHRRGSGWLKFLTTLNSLKLVWRLLCSLCHKDYSKLGADGRVRTQTGKAGYTNKELCALFCPALIDKSWHNQLKACKIIVETLDTGHWRIIPVWVTSNITELFSLNRNASHKDFPVSHSAKLVPQ